MKVIVTKYLNVRVGAPSVNAPCYQYLAPGSELEVDGNIFYGDYYNGNNEWYKDQVGNYYWRGGVSEIIAESKVVSTAEKDISAFNTIAVFPPSLQDWNGRIVKLLPDIKNTLGEGINIAVLDTGIEKQHLDLDKPVIDSRDFTTSAFGDLDVQGHGTEMASLIAGNPFFISKGVRGVAPEAKIFSAKVMYDENDPQDFLSVSNALDYLFDKNIDIINMSIGRADSVKVMADKISRADKTIFFGAAKENGTNPDQLLKLFPANHPSVIAVCALTEQYLKLNYDKLPFPLVIFPHMKSWCCSIKYRHFYFEDSGSSIATALLSGICALLLSHNPTIERNKAAILSELDKYSSPVQDIFNKPPLEIHFHIKKQNK
jgi:subtilisin family serine protease